MCQASFRTLMQIIDALSFRWAIDGLANCVSYELWAVFLWKIEFKADYRLKAEKENTREEEVASKS